MDSAASLRVKLKAARDRIEELESAAHAPSVKYVEREVEKIVYVDREIEKHIVVEIPVAMYPEKVIALEKVVEVNVDNPALIETIKVLKEKICRLTSQLDS